MAQKQISSALQKSGLSLKDRYEKKQKKNWLWNEDRS